VLALAQPHSDHSGPSTLERGNDEIARHGAVGDIRNTGETGQAPRIREVVLNHARAKSVELWHLHAKSIGDIIGTAVRRCAMPIIHG
jgi:hypothetical protein